MARILPLPPDAISVIQSSKQITSLQGVVLSLLENALDAECNKVEISVDFPRGCCTIEDNGVGIQSAEFLETGGLGNMYHTSKHLASGDADFHGATGTYLASLSALSLLSITSKHDGSSDSAALTIHQGKAIARRIPAAQIDELSLSPGRGTRVTVRDLFGNMPVRVKQRALTADSGDYDAKAWQELKHGIVALLLAWPRPCSVKICDLNVVGRKVHISAQDPSTSHALTKKSLDRLAGGRSKFEPNDMLPVLFQAGVAPADSRMKWVPLSAASLNISVRGSICLDPAPTKACQFISLGISPCGAKDGYADLYEAINLTFSNSSFGAKEDDSFDIDDEEKVRRESDRRFKQDGFTRKQVQGRKGVDRWPMFMLQVKFKDHTEKGHRITDRSLKAIIDILEAAVREWLTAHYFRPRQKRQRNPISGEESPASTTSTRNSGRSTPATTTPLTKRMSNPEDKSSPKWRKLLDSSGRLGIVEQDSKRALRPMSGDFSTWSRIKSGKRQFYDQIWDGKRPTSAADGLMGSAAIRQQAKQCPFRLPTLEAGELSARKIPNGNALPIARHSEPVVYEKIADSAQKGSSDDFGSIDDEELQSAADRTEREAGMAIADDTIMEWTDPGSKQTYKVNSRTGVVLPSRPKSRHATPPHISPPRASAAINTSLTSAGLPLVLSKRPPTAEKSNAKWLTGFLKDWDNPVFARQDEEPIPVASFRGPGIDADEATARLCTNDEKFMHFHPAGESGTRKLSKTALCTAQVVQQVDRKFILCKVREATDEVLVLVDQHAASERVILEGLLEELCDPVDNSVALTTGSRVKTIYLDKPLRFRITHAEFELFRTHSEFLADWGILYQLHQRQEGLSASQVRPAKDENIITVTTLPPSIAERCTLFPKLLIELLRSEIWTISPSVRKPAERYGNHNMESNPPDADSNEQLPSHSWLTRIGSCPKGILDMLNSRACRSAIMFNDELLVAQCEVLLRDLSKCAFPFMCAHGRVSMVPLAELGGVGRVDVERESTGTLKTEKEASMGFADSFKRWRGVENALFIN